MKQFLFATVIALSSLAGATDHTLDLGIAAGLAVPQAPSLLNDSSKQDVAVGIFADHSLTDKLGLELAYDRLEMAKKGAGAGALLQQFELGLKYRFFQAEKWNAFLKLSPSYSTLKSLGSESRDGFGANAKLGAALVLSPIVSVGAQVGYHWQDKAASFTDAQVFSAMGFFSFRLCGASKDAMTTPAAAPTPAVAAPVVTAPGAAVDGDDDADGVPNSKDLCANTAAGVAVNAYGCPKGEKASVRIEVQFAAGKAVLAAGADSEIAHLADFMKSNGETKVEIAGYTDSSGNKAANRKLSLLRAQAVVDAVVAKGISKSRLTAKGYGPDHPIADNATVEGREKNRRVVAEIIADKK